MNRTTDEAAKEEEEEQRSILKKKFLSPIIPFTNISLGYQNFIIHLTHLCGIATDIRKKKKLST